MKNTTDKNTADLRILFATSFSDACFRTAPALAQFADKCQVELTLLHVAKPGVASIETRRALNSFSAELDSYGICRRTMIEAADPVKAIAEFCNSGDFDLVFAPASDRLGIHSLFHSSFRARLIEECNAPVWTAGSCLDAIRRRPAVSTIACLLDFDSAAQPHLRLAAALAPRLGAELRLLHVIPQGDEGLLAKSVDSRAPLCPDVTQTMARCVFGGDNCPEVEVAIGDLEREVPALLSRCDADLLFVGPGQSLRGILRPSLSSMIDRAPCPVVCVDGAAKRRYQWSFNRELAEPELLLESGRQQSLAS
jgi:nucleotide-binding universal stress UspA family protein